MLALSPSVLALLHILGHKQHKTQYSTKCIILIFNIASQKRFVSDVELFAHCVMSGLIQRSKYIRQLTVILMLRTTNVPFRAYSHHLLLISALNRFSHHTCSKTYFTLSFHTACISKSVNFTFLLWLIVTVCTPAVILRAAYC